MTFTQAGVQLFGQKLEMFSEFYQFRVMCVPNSFQFDSRGSVHCVDTINDGPLNNPEQVTHSQATLSTHAKKDTPTIKEVLLK